MDDLKQANLFDILLLYLGFRTRYRVVNDSMLPLLKDGDQVIVKKNANFKNGDLVIAWHPFKKNVELIKRISEIDDRGNVTLLSENLDEGQDSRSFGAVSIECIKGKVIARL